MSVVRSVAPDIVVAARIADVYEAVARLKLSSEAPRLGVMVRGLEVQYVHDVSAYRDYSEMDRQNISLQLVDCERGAGRRLAAL